MSRRTDHQENAMLTLRAKPLLGVILAAAVALPTVWVEPSFAAPVHHHVRHNHRLPPPPVAEAPYAAFPERDVTTASACIPMCPSDYLPCDPIYFKLADGRCDGKYW
jgi:hypothetical protein